MLFFLFPDGQKINAGQLLNYSINVSTFVITWNYVMGGGNTYIAPNLITAQAILNQMDANIGSDFNGIVSIQSLPCVLQSCVPTTFAGSGSTIDIYGQGFYPGMANGVLHIEDVGGGYDSNGYTYSIINDTPNHFTATWATNGDGGTGAGFFIYYTDPSGIIASSTITGITLT